MSTPGKSWWVWALSSSIRYFTNQTGGCIQPINSRTRKTRCGVLMQENAGCDVHDKRATHDAGSHLNRSNDRVDALYRQLNRQSECNTDRKHSQHAADTED